MRYLKILIKNIKAKQKSSMAKMLTSESNKKFVRRFTAVENAVKASGKDMKDCSLDELDAIWNRVKQQEKRNDKQ